MNPTGHVAPHPFAACKGVHGFTVMRDAWDAIQSDPEFERCVPFRCSVCRWWHCLPGPAARRAVEQGRESAHHHCEGVVSPTRGPAEPLTREAVA